MNLLNEIRKRQGLKFRELSRLTGYSIGHLGNIFSGRLAIIPKVTQRKIAKALGVKRALIFR